MANMVQVRSKRDPEGQHYLENATLIVGAGERVVFEHGQAMVTPEQAEMLCNRGDLDVDGYTAPAGDVAPQGRALPARLESASDDELLAAAAWLTERDEQTSATATGDPSVDEVLAQQQPGLPADPDADVAKSATTQVSPEVQAMREHLAADGEHVPKLLPENFTATTPEGEPRCYARKGDGSQCQNTAVEHEACGLAAHKAQVAALP